MFRRGRALPARTDKGGQHAKLATLLCPRLTMETVEDLVNANQPKSLRLCRIQ